MAGEELGPLDPDTPETPEYFETLDRTLELGNLVNHETICFAGKWSELAAFARSLRPGQRVVVGEPDDGSGDVSLPTELPDGGDDTEHSTGSVEWGHRRIASVRTRRTPGGNGILTVLISQNAHRCTVCRDFAEVSKNILAWKADDVDDPPDLSMIAKWRQLEADDPAAYAALEVDGTALAGNTAKLAAMILKGIDSYTVHVPIVTITSVTASTPQPVALDVRLAEFPDHPYGWPDVNGEDASDVVTDDFKWMCTAQRDTQNADGTHQWVIVYQAADEFEADLYGDENAGSGGGGGGEEQPGGEGE